MESEKGCKDSPSIINGNKENALKLAHSIVKRNVRVSGHFGQRPTLCGAAQPLNAVSWLGSQDRLLDMYLDSSMLARSTCGAVSIRERGGRGSSYVG
jgi:hypothetical protein